MASSLSNLVNNLSEGIYKIKCKYGHDLWNYIQSMGLFSWLFSIKYRTQMFMLQQKLSTKVWGTFKWKIFEYINIF